MKPSPHWDPWSSLGHPPPSLELYMKRERETRGEKRREEVGTYAGTVMHTFENALKQLIKNILNEQIREIV